MTQSDLDMAKARWRKAMKNGRMLLVCPGDIAPPHPPAFVVFEDRKPELPIDTMRRYAERT